jgi:hypothetical protein
VVLRAILADLTALVDLLRSAGESDASFVRLGQACASLTPLLGQAAPDPGEIDRHHAEIVAVLEAWLKLVPADPKCSTGGHRQAFWK